MGYKNIATSMNDDKRLARMKDSIVEIEKVSVESFYYFLICEKACFHNRLKAHVLLSTTVFFPSAAIT
jgi:hypothetical protein